MERVQRTIAPRPPIGRGPRPSRVGHLLFRVHQADVCVMNPGVFGHQVDVNDLAIFFVWKVGVRDWQQ